MGTGTDCDEQGELFYFTGPQENLLRGKTEQMFFWSKVQWIGKVEIQERTCSSSGFSTDGTQALKVEPLTTLCSQQRYLNFLITGTLLQEDFCDSSTQRSFYLNFLITGTLLQEDFCDSSTQQSFKEKTFDSSGFSNFLLCASVAVLVP